jgi:hypothetical protein
MELSPSWETSSRSSTQEIPNILWNPMVYYSVNKKSPLIPALSQVNPVHNTTSSFCNINFNIIPNLRLDLRSVLRPSGFPTKIFFFFFGFMRATFHAHLMFLDLIILTLFGEKYKLWSVSLCKFLQPTHNIYNLIIWKVLISLRICWINEDESRNYLPLRVCM